MDLDLQQQVQQRLAELPQDVRDAVQSAEVAQKIQTIGKRGNLHVDQMGKLEDEVYLVMLGFADPGEFAESLAGELSLAPAQSVAIATDVANEIFMPIRASMQSWAEDHTAQEDAKLVADALSGPPAAAVPASTPAAPKPAPAAPTGLHDAASPIAPNIVAAEVILSPKLGAPAAPKPIEPGKPQQYKADPYREPVE
jgi:hypothetical protein